MEFRDFTKIARLSREIAVTEKIDGTNAQIAIWLTVSIQGILDNGGREDGMIEVIYNDDSYTILPGSRNRWISVTNDNMGFASWVNKNANELVKLGEGTHFGEWWGQGIQRGYGLKERRFSLFNTSRWSDDSVRPSCCHVVPVLYQGIFNTYRIQDCLDDLVEMGSSAALGFMNPEGVVIYHTAANVYFKKTIKNDESPKSLLTNV